MQPRNAACRPLKSVTTIRIPRRHPKTREPMSETVVQLRREELNGRAMAGTVITDGSQTIRA